MEEQTGINEFDSWYQNLILVLAKDGKRAPYKTAWLDLFEAGMSPEEAAIVGPFEMITS
ncbi:hypothetical protein [Klebsiella quasipneumoniae]|uniref:hypothetical protein n=1 Tax=Klebsiella quasipneumoniae TaxID=1463165 RepID=UPI00388FCED3